MHTNPETLALLALGEQAGTPAEREHVAECGECSAEISELAYLAGVGRATSPSDTLVRPSPVVWKRIRAELGFTSEALPAPEPPSSNGAEAVDLSQPRTDPTRATATEPGAAASAAGPASTGAARAPAGRRLLSLTLAAALALIAGVGIGLGIDQLRNRDEVIATAILKPGGPQWADANGEAEILVDRQGHKYLAASVTTPRQVPDERQIWVISATNPTEMKNLGVFYNNEQRFRVDDIDLAQYPLVDISNEPDANPAHSGNTIVRGPLVW